ncbi:S-layer homology domain-containing protein [Bacillus paranthracis]|uniref:S-layer homology domain-containing protein n=1 Tax=Bacillus paranthracis TaxID=2026186 RepID=UPI0021D120BF|nr:S-layer homology domain-containing protein [Bacillus paranthracis]MCU5208853.1 S-layer homology domain-containing protein [Bacillus paranthracis]
MKIVKIATTGLIALGSLTFPSCSLAELENTAQSKVEINQNTKTEPLNNVNERLGFLKQEQKRLLQLQENLKIQQDFYNKEELLKQQVILENSKEDTHDENEKLNLQKSLDDLHEKQEKLQKEIDKLKGVIGLSIEPGKKIEVSEENQNNVEVKDENKGKEKNKSEKNKEALKLVQERLELLTKEEAELKAQEEQQKKEAELKAREEQQKKEAELKAQEEQQKKETELKAQEEQQKKETELKAQEEQQKKEAGLKVQKSLLASATSKPNFPDIPRWAKNSIDYLVNKDVINGMPDGTFSPNLEIDRGSAATIMARILNLPVDASDKPTFKDSQNHWATPYIAAVEKAGVIKGEGNGKFNPSGKLTRAAMASMLVNAYKLDGKVTGNPPTVFSDLNGHWGEKYVNILVELGISNGYGDNNWKPDQTITRAETGSLVAQTDISKDKVVNRKRIYMSKSFFTYHGASLSSGIAFECTPQNVTVYEERGDGWIKIHTYQGFKWIMMNEKRVYIDRTFTTFDNPSRTANTLVTYLPQTVTVVEERGTWLRIRTALGLQWLNTQKETMYLSRVFFAYDNPNFSSRVAGKYAPQTVDVVSEKAGGWIQISTNYGLKWVNAAYLNNNQVILDVPARYQFPELYNGCEVVSLQMLVEHYTGRTFNKVDFAFQMPFDKTRLQKQNGRIKIWGDPDVGFVGDVTGNTPGYAINPGPLKQLLDKYARGTNLTGNSFSVLENYVRNGKPVVTWVTESLNSPGSISTWKTPQGKTIYARMNTHAVVLTGVDDNYVYYNDPILGTKNVKANKSWFASIYNQMGQKALSID